MAPRDRYPASDPRVKLHLDYARYEEDLAHQMNANALALQHAHLWYKKEVGKGGGTFNKNWRSHSGIRRDDFLAEFYGRCKRAGWPVDGKSLGDVLEQLPKRVARLESLARDHERLADGYREDAYRVQRLGC